MEQLVRPETGGLQAPPNKPDSPPRPLFGAIEAGGTKFECAVARSVEDVIASQRFETTTPAETFAQVLEFFASIESRHGPIRAFGIGSFGPIDLDRQSPSYGHILATPKPGWSHYDIRARLRERSDTPIYLDTDVNAAALAEWRHGAGAGLHSLVYVTVGTGIGGGAVLAGRPLSGLWHPEMGHIRVQRHTQDQTFPGVCPFHRDCLEGLANGPAILARWGVPMSSLLQDRVACSVIGGYLGQLAATMTLLLAPERIVFGGGVMTGGDLLPYIRQCAKEQLGGYLEHRLLQGSLEEFITAPGLGDRSGIAGAILLAQSGID
jgi:fructokinase